MIIKQYLTAITQIDEMVNNLLMTKTLLQEELIKEAYNNQFLWRNKADNKVTAFVVGINYQTKKVSINTTNYMGISLTYAEFMDKYELANWK